MIKGASILVLSFLGSVVLWGCKSSDEATNDELISCCKDAVKQYGAAKTTEECKKIAEDTCAKVKEITKQMDPNKKELTQLTCMELIEHRASAEAKEACEKLEKAQDDCEFANILISRDKEALESAKSSDIEVEMRQQAMG